ncbi:AraC-like ligand-binding domain-containing protein [Streptomyces atratus]|uniref:AraC-like ligand-binding domain-containing protein n=1 Tax=Streptomyces atratus TaxID=1893 RepID=UPI003662F771
MVVMSGEWGPAGDRGAGASSLVSMSSGELPRGDRFDWYVELVRESIAPFSLSSAHAHGFKARVAAVDLGSVQMTHFVFEPLRAARTLRHIRRSDPETYQLALVGGSPMSVRQCGNDAEVDTGSLVFFDTSHPLDAFVPDEHGQGRVTLLRIPKQAFPLPAGQADRVLSRRLTPDGVSGAVLCQYLTTIRDRATDLARASVIGSERSRSISPPRSSPSMLTPGICYRRSPASRSCAHRSTPT